MLAREHEDVACARGARPRRENGEAIEAEGGERRKEGKRRPRARPHARVHASGRARARAQAPRERACAPTALSRALVHARTVPRARADVIPPGTYSARRQRPTPSRTALRVLLHAFGVYTRQNPTSHELFERSSADGWLNQQHHNPTRSSNTHNQWEDGVRGVSGRPEM